MPLLIAARSWASKLKLNRSLNIRRIDCLSSSMSRSAVCIGVIAVSQGKLATMGPIDAEGQGQAPAHNNVPCACYALATLCTPTKLRFVLNDLASASHCLPIMLLMISGVPPV